MCNQLVQRTMHTSIGSQIFGFTLIRITFGLMFLIFGYNKIISGNANLTQLGSAMSFFGITQGYLIWGYLAALTEFCGGVAYILGFCIRIMSLPMIFLLAVAIKFHLQKGDAFTAWSFPALCLCIVISFLFAGSGTYSVDHALHSHVHND